MNATVAQLTARQMLGRRRSLVLLLLPGALLALAVLIRLLVGTDENLAGNLLGAFALATLMPLIGLIAGTGVVGPEIDDGSIVYILAKPISRLSIVLSKLAVATATVAVLGVLPVLASGLILTAEVGTVTAAYTAAALAASLGYASLFLLLAVITRNAVVVGLLYALGWETIVGLIAPGAQVLSVQQGALAVAEWVAGDQARELGINSAVSFPAGAAMLAVLVAGSIVLATRRLGRLHLNDES